MFIFGVGHFRYISYLCAPVVFFLGPLMLRVGGGDGGGGGGAEVAQYFVAVVTD